jgi:hypothetical protein
MNPPRVFGKMKASGATKPFFEGLSGLLFPKPKLLGQTGGQVHVGQTAICLHEEIATALCVGINTIFSTSKHLTLAQEHADEIQV